MHVWAQVDPTPVIEKATGVSWEAGMLALIIFAFMSAITYLMKRQNDNARDERAVWNEREKRLGTRIDVLEDELKASQRLHSEQLVSLIREVTSAILRSNEEQAATRATLGNLERTMGLVNGDIKEMCRLLTLSPCLIAGRARGDLRILDKDGNEIAILEAKV